MHARKHAARAGKNKAISERRAMSSKPWYPRYPRDFRAKTVHLNLLERGAYDALIDHYYEIQEPLPCDPSALYRIAGAFSRLDRAAVDRVSKEFFTNGDGRLRNRRCDEEIAKMKARSDQQAELANRRWKGHATAHAMASATAHAENMPVTVTVKESISRPKRSPNKTLISPNYIISDEMAEWAVAKGVNPDHATEQFINHHTAKGSQFANWDAAWRNWIINAVKFAKT